MELNSNESLIGTHRAVLFTKDISLKGIVSVFPWAPGLLGHALVQKLLDVENVEGKIYITNERIHFETSKFDKFLGVSNLEFDVCLKDVTQIKTGRRLWKKTVIIFFQDTAIELSVFRTGKMISEIESALS